MSTMQAIVLAAAFLLFGKGAADSNATVFTALPLSLSPPRPAGHPSVRRGGGFPPVLQLHSRSLEQQRPVSYLAHRLTGSHRLRGPGSSPAEWKWTSRYATADLYGGITAVGEYYLRVKVGGQVARVQVDTGSATMAIPMKGCNSCLSGDNRYDPEESHSKVYAPVACDSEFCGKNTCVFKDSCGGCSQSSNACCAKESKSDCSFELKYGDGSGARGILIQEILELADGVEGQVLLGGILHDSSDFERPSVDGIMGLAFRGLACTPTCAEPVFDTFVRTKVVKDDVFTICLSQEGGALVLGGYNPGMGVEKPQWVDIAGDSDRTGTYYQLELSGKMLVDGKELSLPDFTNAIVDSGTTLMSLSKNAFGTLVKHLTTEHCNVPQLCDSPTWFKPASCVAISDDELATMPTLSIPVGSVVLELEPKDYMVEYKDGSTMYRCVGFMEEDPVSGVEVILGNTVMLKYAVIHDRVNHRLGFMKGDGTCGGRAQDTSTSYPPLSVVNGDECSGFSSCKACAAHDSCAFNHKTGACYVPTEQSLAVYPVCHGKGCVCSIESWVNPVSVVFAGLLAACVAFASLVVSIRWVRHRMIYSSDSSPSQYSVHDENEEFLDEEDFN